MTHTPLHIPKSARRLMAMATLALAGTAVWAAGPGGRGMDMPFGGPGMGHMLDKVGATVEQRNQIEQIMRAARDDLRAQREAGRALHEQMRQLFVQPTVDADAVEALRVQMLAQHDLGSQRMTQAMLETSRVLSAEQRQQLADAMKQRAEHMREHRGRHDRDAGPGA